MPLYYSAYGLRISTNQQIPGLVFARGTRAADLEVGLQFMPDGLRRKLGTAERTWCSPNRDRSGRPLLQIRRTAGCDYIWFLYSDGFEFFVNQEGTRVWATWPDGLILDDVIRWLRGPVLGLVLRLRGVTSLHASGFSIRGQAIAIMGPQGSGKSTLAAAFARRGYPVLSDDILAVHEENGAFHVAPGYPQLCLWPDSVTTLYGSHDALPRITPSWGKRYLDLKENGHRFEYEPLAVAAIYLLGDRSSGQDAPFVEATEGGEQMTALLSNTFGSYLTDRFMRARDFELLGRLATRVPIRRVVPHVDSMRLSGLCDRILEDAEALIPSMPAKTCADDRHMASIQRCGS